MSGLPLISDASLQKKPGSFGARVDASGLYLPLDVHLCAQIAGWPSAEEFFLATFDFPDILQDTFGWSMDECRQASEELRNLLRGHVSDKVLDPIEVEKHPTGVPLPDPNEDV